VRRSFEHPRNPQYDVVCERQFVLEAATAQMILVLPSLSSICFDILFLTDHLHFDDLIVKSSLPL